MANNDIEKRLWATADQLLANSSLMPSEYSGPVLGFKLPHRGAVSLHSMDSASL